MKRVFLCILCAATLEAQSISITHPAANDSVSGFSGYYFQVALTSAPTVVEVCYTVDTYAAYNPGIDAPTTLGCSIIPPFNYPYNTYWNLNGTHQVVATAYDSLGRVVATSAAIQFTTANNWPLPCTPGMTVATGTALTFNWSGSVNVTPTILGSCSGDSKNFTFFVDGVTQYAATGVTAASYAFPIDTTQFQNGNHNVCVEVYDGTISSGTTYTGADGGYSGDMGEWCRTVNFQNGAVASQALLNAHEIYLAAGATFTLTAKILKTDGTTSSTTPFFASTRYYAQGGPNGLLLGANVGLPGSATVGQSTGLITAGSNGSVLVSATVPTITGSDLAIGGSNMEVKSVSHPALMTASSYGRQILITGGSGWTPGVYTVTAVNIGTNVILDRSPAALGASGGSFQSGPTRQAWVFINPTQNIPCVAGNGVIYSSYNASCAIMHEMFTPSLDLITLDQPYNSPLSPGSNILTCPYCGALADFNASSLTTFELGAGAIIYGNEPAAGNGAAWIAAQAANIATQEALLSGYPKLGFYLIGSNFVNETPFSAQFSGLWGSTTGPAGQWSTTAWEYSLSQWFAQRNVRGMNMQDEGNSEFGGSPLQGPIQYANSSTQSWLQSIAASSGTCTASMASSPPFSINGAKAFVISGSSVAGMNSAPGSVYTINPSNFTFACAGVANGTYNSSNDPGLILEPFATGWVVGGTNVDYARYDSFARLKTQAMTVSPRFGFTMSNSGTAPCYSVANWNGNGTQSIGSVTQFGEYTDFYPENGVFNYIASRLSSNDLLAYGNTGEQTRAYYGCFNPSLPLNILTGATINFYGIGQGAQAGVTSTSGNTINFSAPHGITNVVPGLTRIYISGATDTGGPADTTNNNFYVLNCPTTTTCNVLLAATDFTSTGNTANGGTATFQDGSTVALTSINARGTAANCAGIAPSHFLCGDQLNVTAWSANNYRKRGQTFTLCGVTGSGAGNFNNCSGGGKTFMLLPENLNLGAQPTNGYQYQLFYRQIPSLSATGGTATIIQDDNYVKGRNGSRSLQDSNPGFTFGQTIECYILGCAGERIYKAAQHESGYSDQLGFTSEFPTSQIPTFADTTLNTGGQLYMNQHFENAAAVPLFHAHNIAGLIGNRLTKYLLAAKLNSPDYGPLMDCGARAGAAGNLLLCLNASDGAETEQFTLTPYLQAGQNIIRYVANDHSITQTTLTAGTATDSVTLQPMDAVFYVFPAAFAGELQQPPISAGLADVPNATKVVVRYSYDRYYLDSAIGNTFDCGTGTCTPPWDRNIGAIYFRLIYLGPSSEVLATSDIQTL